MPEQPKTDKPLNRKHISRAEREALLRQRITIGTAAVVLLIVLILGGGALYSYFVEPGQPMAEVYGETITRREFYQRVNFERFRLFQVIEDTKEQFLELNSDPETAGFLGQFYEQQLQQLGQIYGGVGSQTLEQMIDERIIEREAAARNITVTDEEVDEEIRRQIARMEDAQIEVDVTATAEAAVAATATAELFTPTPTLEPTATTRVTTTATVEATEALTPTMTPFPTLTPAPTLTPNIFSEDRFAPAYQTFLDELRRRVGYTEQDYRRIIRLELLRKKLQEQISSQAEVDTTEEQVHAAHILIGREEGTLEEAQQVLERLKAGEDFAEVAAEVSDDTSNAEVGGDLGWFGRSQMIEPFANAAFALTEPEQISEIVETQFGWHIIKLLEGPEQRPLPETAIQQARDNAFTEFLSNAKTTEAAVKRLWSIDDMPSDPFIDEIREPLPTPIVVPSATTDPNALPTTVLEPTGTVGGSDE